MQEETPRWRALSRIWPWMPESKALLTSSTPKMRRSPFLSASKRRFARMLWMCSHPECFLNPNWSSGVVHWSVISSKIRDSNSLQKAVETVIGQYEVHWSAGLPFLRIGWTNTTPKLSGMMPVTKIIWNSRERCSRRRLLAKLKWVPDIPSMPLDFFFFNLTILERIKVRRVGAKVEQGWM